MSASEADSHAFWGPHIERYYRNEWNFDGSDNETNLVARTLADCGPVDGTWLDLGSGPTGPLWMPFVRARRIILADLDARHLLLAAYRLAAMQSGQELWQNEIEALKLAKHVTGDSDASWPSISRDCVETVVHDNRRPRTEMPGLSWRNKADLITMIGCICAGSDHALMRGAIWRATDYLAADGKLVVAGWLRDTPLTRLPEKFSLAPSLYIGNGEANNLSADEMLYLIESCGLTVLKAHVLEGQDLSLATRENGTARMVIATTRLAK